VRLPIPPPRQQIVLFERPNIFKVGYFFKNIKNQVPKPKISLNIKKFLSVVCIYPAPFAFWFMRLEFFRVVHF
jgi:hypothetical protein